MRNMPKIMILAMLAVLSFASLAVAFEEVRVFQPRFVLDDAQKENPDVKPRELSPSELRREALMLGFSEAVLQATIGLLPAQPEPERMEALRAFLETKAGDWVLGYKEIASSATEEGLNMVLEVDVNRRALRDAVESLGLDRSANQPEYVTILPMPTLLEADKAALASVMKLVNAMDRPGSGPRIEFKRLESGTLRGELVSDKGAWTAMDADMETVWFALWDTYRSMSVTTAAGSGKELVVTGWFTTEGANDFDRVLQSWDDLVRTARLLEMDLGTEGVSARWSVQPVNMSALQAKLRDYLPSRGLEFHVE